jgi:hypothetical protein
MSSTYYALCLSHDPALTVDGGEWSHGYDAAAAALRSGFPGHPGCDLVVGRYSAPLIEVACVGNCRGRHTDLRWTDVGWLRLLLLAGPEVASNAALNRVTSCWSFDRASRLRVELDMAAAT